MSTGRSRGALRRKRQLKTFAATKRRRNHDSESDSSKAYTAGHAFAYTYRIAGPQYPVTVYNINQLPEGSKLAKH